MKNQNFNLFDQYGIFHLLWVTRHQFISEIQGWGDRDTCDSVNPPIPYIYQGAVIENPLKMTVS